MNLKTLFICLLPILSWAQSLQFPREAIQFTLDSVHFTVNGYYYFVNKSNTQFDFSISYPFPVESSAIDSTWIINCKTMQPIRYAVQQKSLQFVVHLACNDTLILNIGYRQLHDGHTVTYILTTTHFWGAPLENASYTLQVKPPLQITKLSLNPNETKVIQNEQYYFFRRTGFMPESDFIVTFARN